LVTLPLAVSPRAPGSLETTVVFLNLQEHVVDEQIAVVADQLRPQRDRLEAFLIHEVIPAAVGVEVRRGHHLEIRLAELLGGLEGLVEHGPRQQVPHLDADERLPAARRRLRDFDVEAVIRRVLELEEHLSLDVDRFNQAGHAGASPKRLL
jgi:hypothetical protein